MLKKYLLGGTAMPTAGDGCYAFAAHTSKKAGASTNSTNIEYGASPQSPTPPAIKPQHEMPHGADSSREAANSKSDSFNAESARPSINIATSSPVHVNAWKDFEIPSELSLLYHAPVEIVNIIQESLDNHQALRLSRNSESQDEDSERSLIITDKTASSEHENLAVSSASNSVSDRSFNRSQESVTTIDSDTNNTTVLPRPLFDTMRSEPSKSKKIIKKDKRFALLGLPKSQEGKNGPPSPTHGRNPLKRFNFRRSRAAGVNSFMNSREQPSFECTSCFDEVQDYVALNCTHKYCRECFVCLVQSALKSEALWPPKCCLTEIPRPLMRKHLPDSDIQLFDAKALEYAVPTEHRYYCISPQCGSFIDTRISRQAGTNLLQCRSCWTQICSMCRGQPHPGNNECPQDFGLLATLEVSEMEGWRRCYGCHAMVELNMGCRHITCTCGAEFCYTCGARWRTCHCSEADQRQREQQLAAVRERREAEALAEQEEMRRAIAAVAEAERQLREEREAAEAREQERLRQEAAELARLESERLIQIAERYVELRSIIAEISEQQKQAIEKRHLKEEDEMDCLRLEFDQRVADQAKDITADKGNTEAQNLRQLKDLRKQQASALMALIARHRHDQDRVLATLAVDDSGDGEVQRACALEDLLPQQETERNELKQKHAAEVDELQQAGRRAIDNLKLDVRIQRMKFETEEQMMTRIDETNRRQEADLKWFDLIWADRHTMLVDDERNLVNGGRDVPVGGVPPTPDSA